MQQDRREPKKGTGENKDTAGYNKREKKMGKGWKAGRRERKCRTGAVWTLAETTRYRGSGLTCKPHRADPEREGALHGKTRGGFSSQLFLDKNGKRKEDRRKRRQARSLVSPRRGKQNGGRGNCSESIIRRKRATGGLKGRLEAAHGGCTSNA